MLLGANIYAFSQRGLFYRFLIFSISKNGKKVTICYFFGFRHMARHLVKTDVWLGKTSIEKNKINTDKYIIIRFFILTLLTMQTDRHTPAVPETCTSVYTRWAMRSSRSPASMSMTGISTIV